MTTYKELVDFARKLDRKKITNTPKKIAPAPGGFLDFDLQDLEKLAPKIQPTNQDIEPLTQKKVTHAVGGIGFYIGNYSYNKNPNPTNFSQSDLVWMAIDDIFNASQQTFFGDTVLPKFHKIDNNEHFFLPVFLSERVDNQKCYEVGFYQAVFVENSNPQPRHLNLTFDDGSKGMLGVGLLTHEKEDLSLKLDIGRFSYKKSPYIGLNRHISQENSHGLILQPGQVGLLVCVGRASDWHPFSTFTNCTTYMGRGNFENRVNWSDLPIISEPMTKLRNGERNLTGLFSLEGN